MNLFGWTIVVLCAASLAMAADDKKPNKPATRPSGPQLGEMNLQTFPELNYIYATEKTDLAHITQAVDKHMPVLLKAIDDGKLRTTMPCVFVYREFKFDAPFELEMGWIVHANAKPVDGLKQRKLPPFKCATLLYTGAMATIGEAYGKLLGQMQAAGLQPLDESREVYLYIEGRDSANNVTQIQVGYK